MSPAQRALLCVVWHWKRLSSVRRLGSVFHGSRGLGQRTLWGTLGRPWIAVQAVTFARYSPICHGSCMVMAKQKKSEKGNADREEKKGKSKLKREIRKEYHTRSKHKSSRSVEHKHKRKKEKKEKKRKKRGKERHGEKRKLRVNAKKIKELKLCKDPPPLIDIASTSESEAEIQLVYDSRRACVKGGKRLVQEAKVVTTASTNVVQLSLPETSSSNKVCAGFSDGAASAACSDNVDGTGCSDSVASAGCTDDIVCTDYSDGTASAACTDDTPSTGPLAVAGPSSIEEPLLPDCNVASVLGPDTAGTKPSQWAVQAGQLRWETVTMGKPHKTSGRKDNVEKHSLVFDVLSYNVLAQGILEEHPYLYTKNNHAALEWASRGKLLMQEFVAFNSDILCLQEVQQSHLKTFYSKLNDLGYSGLYKQRTGNKVDGVAIYYKNSKFRLIDYATVEYYQAGVSILNRDNVALVAKFAPVDQPKERLVVATTHLLFNPNRHDVKLAQLQLLLAEVERFAFRELDLRTGASSYWPVILTGDMNFEHTSGPFKLLTEGWFKFEGLGNRRLLPGAGRPLSRYLLPPSLGITDTCQHWNLLLHRNVPVPSVCERLKRESEDHSAELALIQLYNSDHKKLPVPEDQILNPYMSEYTSTNDLPGVGFGTGQLSHRLNLRSVYNHSKDEGLQAQVSTFQDDWVVVDYIFYSQATDGSCPSSQLQLLARFKLLTAEEAEQAGPIPNAYAASDHYPLAAKFALIL